MIATITPNLVTWHGNNPLHATAADAWEAWLNAERFEAIQVWFAMAGQYLPHPDDIATPDELRSMMIAFALGAAAADTESPAAEVFALAGPAAALGYRNRSACCLYAVADTYERALWARERQATPLETSPCPHPECSEGQIPDSIGNRGLLCPTCHGATRVFRCDHPALSDVGPGIVQCQTCSRISPKAGR